MDFAFFDYLERLEMMAFFSGYPLIYAIVIFIAGKQKQNTTIKSKIVSLLPFSYALIGTLFLGLQLRNLYPDYSLENIELSVQLPYLKIWALFSLLFWVPIIARKTVLSLLHSLVFFFFLARDLFLHTFQSTADNNIVRTEMKIYSDSLILNLGAFLVILLTYFILNRIRSPKNTSHI